MGTNNYIFSIGFLLLALLYVLTFFYMLSRLRRQRMRERILFSALMSYILMRILMIGNFTLYSMSVVEWNSDNLVYNFALNSLFISDCIFIIAFAAFFRHYLAFTYYAHIPLNAAHQKAFFENHSWFTYPIISFLIAQGVVISLYNFSVIGVSQLMIDDTIQNLTLFGSFVIFHMYMRFKFSGTPYLSEKYKKSNRIVIAFTFYLAFSRLLIASVDIYLTDHNDAIFQLIDSNPDSLIWKQFIIVASLIITEVIPFAAIASRPDVFLHVQSMQSLSLNENLMQSQLNNEEEQINSINNNNNKNGQVTDKQTSKGSNKPNQKDKEENSDDSNLFYSDQQFPQSSEDLQKAQLTRDSSGGESTGIFRSGGLGKIYQSQTKKAIRKIEIKNVSQYLKDEVLTDIQKQRGLKLKGLVPILDCQWFVDETIIAYPYFQLSLRTLIQKSKPQSTQQNESADVTPPPSPITGKQPIDYKQLPTQSPPLNGSNPTNSRETDVPNGINNNEMSSPSQNMQRLTILQKGTISLQIARLLKNLHSRGFVHGHLHSVNILFDDKLRPYIADLGLTAFKKYLGYKGLYTNKSAFTCPENLDMKGTVISTTNPASDTYSFAFILFEMFAEREPFHNLNSKELREVVVVKESRPKIPTEGIPEEIQKLIRCCWYQQAEDRPNFEIICDHLSAFVESLQLI